MPEVTLVVHKYWKYLLNCIVLVLRVDTASEPAETCDPIGVPDQQCRRRSQMTENLSAAPVQLSVFAVGPQWVLAASSSGQSETDPRSSIRPDVGRYFYVPMAIAPHVQLGTSVTIER